MVQEMSDDIVVAGLACRLPESNNSDEFWSHLINKEDMITDDDRRWPPGLHGLPTRSGKLKDIKSFDATFFSVHAKQANKMDPQLRILLELTYESLIDAGLDPQSVRNSRTGVFVGASGSEASEANSADIEEINGYGLVGGCRAMFSNRVSFSFDFKGPSYTVDTACSSSLIAFDCAVQSIRSGACDSAIVGGVNLTLKPNNAVDFLRLNMLAADGRCKSFDVSGNGYVRAEGAVCVYLTKKSVSKRIYAQVVNSKSNSDGFKTQGVTYPSGAVQKQLLQEVYADAGVDPKDVSYIEAHGTGTKAGDPEEVNSITDVFCGEGREGGKPLLIGSVKSNMGHSEPASGLAGMAKVLLSMQHGTLPPNLHFVSPNPDIPGLSDGRLQVVTEPTKWDGGYVGINSFGFGGSNVHVILRSPEIPQSFLQIQDGLQVCVPASGRTKESVSHMLELARSNATNTNLISLMSDISPTPYNTFPFRGYTVLGGANKIENIGEVSSSDRPLWYVFTGMGAQWSKMGARMMSVPAFKQSIENTGQYLKEYGYDLVDVLLRDDEKTYENILNSFVCTAAIQVALVDCLSAAGLVPEGIVGHSVGELGCAYADKSFTAEEVIKAAYWRGRCVKEAKLPAGLMAAVGLSWAEAKKRCPPGVIPACHNSATTITISGEASVMEAFMQELKDEEIFVREVNTSGIAFHSHFMEMIAPTLLESLSKFIQPKKRSSKWLSTSIPEERWESELAQYSSAEYHVNNLVSPVLFQEALTKIPKNAIVVEIAPHCLLQAVLKRSLGEENIILPLMKKHHVDNMEFFFTNLGNIYTAGKNIDPTALSCPRQYPVPLNTPSIAPSMQWDHSQEWDIPKLEQFSSGGAGGVNAVKFDIDISPGSVDSYLEGHCIDGRVLFPATGYLVLAWRALAKKLGLIPDNLRVSFENVEIHRATILPKTGTVTLTVHLLPASNKFDVSEGDNLSVSGKIFPIDEADVKPSNTPSLLKADMSDDITLTSQCVYKELRLRGYDYGPTFQGIQESNGDGTYGKLLWKDNWVSFLDTMLQISVMRLPGRSLRLPTRIRSLKIDPIAHKEFERDSYTVEVDPCLDTVVAGGVTMYGLHASVAPKRQDGQTAVLEAYTHTPYHQESVKTPLEDVDFSQVLQSGGELKTMIDVVIENVQKTTLNVCELDACKNETFREISRLVNNLPLMQLNYIASDRNQELVSKLQGSTTDLGVESSVWNPTKKAPGNISKLDLLVASNLSTEEATELPAIFENIKPVLKPQGFLLLHEATEDLDAFSTLLKDAAYVLVSSIKTSGNTRLQLYRKERESEAEEPIILDIDESFEWVDVLKEELSKDGGPMIWLKSESLPHSGIVGMVNCLCKEPGGNRIRCVFDAESNKEETRGDLVKVFNELCRKDLVMNVYKNGKFGSYRHADIENQADNNAEQTEHAYVNVLTRGDLSSLRWITSPLRYANKKEGNAELCSVYYTSLNFRDIMLATGKLPPDALPGDLAQQDCILGMEFSGKNQSGKRIMGLLPAQALATTVLADQRFTWEVPESWSLLEAATVPVVYSTAYYSLLVRGRLRHGESVLIHSGSGGVGQAAISIALSLGCDVYTTCGTKEKKQYLLQRFPKLDADKIGNSRDLSFENMVMHGTNGRGVHLVLNSLAEEKLQASVRCLARHGRFLEIGKFDLSNNSPLGMSVFLKNVSFHGILLDAIFEQGNQEWKEVADLVSMGIQSGTVQPLKTSMFERDDIEPAFRFMAQGKHIGKVVIQVRNESTPQSSPLNLKAQARSMCDPKKSYVITGGLGGFGLELSDWLITRGAKHLVLTSRRGIRTGYQARKVKVWREKGINVIVSTDDVSTKEGATKLVKETQAIAPIGGIFHLAVVLKDGMFENQTTSSFIDVAKPKLNGTVYLDELTRKEDVAKSMHWFVVFSSVVSGRGNAGQTNYGFANSSMERVCEKRVEADLPGLAIQWGAIGDVGLVQETMGGSNETVIGGTLPQRIGNCLACMDQFLQHSYPVVSSHVLASKQTSKGEKGGKGDIVSSIARILGVKDPTTINPDLSLGDLGLDSLMGVEIKQTLERDYDIQLKANEIRLLTMNEIKKFGENDSSSAEDSTDSSDSSVRDVDIMNAVLPTYSDETLVHLNDVNEGQPIFLIHNIYGTVQPLGPLGKLLTCPVYGVQYTKDAPASSVQELAAFYNRCLKERVADGGTFKILGYSFGATIALEMAIMLKRDGKDVNLVMLEGSHKYVAIYSVFYRQRYNVKTDFDANVDTLCILADKIASVDKEKLKNTLTVLPDLTSQIKETYDVIMESSPVLSKDDVMSYITYFMNLLRMGETYQTSCNYDGDIKVIRAKTVDSMSEKHGDDLGISEVCDGSITTSWVEGDHLSILDGHGAEEIANVILALN